MKSILVPAIVLFVVLSFVCCALYPLAVTGIGKLAFSNRANGSIVVRDGKPIGSMLIGQAFSAPNYFWGRPSATALMPNNAIASGGSNLGPTNPAQIGAINERIEALKAVDPGNTKPIPVDLVTASASGLDPDISIAAALYQESRIARLRNMPVATVRNMINYYAVQQYDSFFAVFFGEPRVNVLALNLALDRYVPTT